MRGYFKDPDLTAFALRGVWLHTGDLGFRDEDGFLFLVGRKNDLIKCAGERISAMEIEEVLPPTPASWKPPWQESTTRSWGRRSRPG